MLLIEFTINKLENNISGRSFGLVYAIIFLFGKHPKFIKFLSANGRRCYALGAWDPKSIVFQTPAELAGVHQRGFYLL